MRQPFRFLFPLLALILVIAACGDDDAGTSSPSTSSTTTAVTTTTTATTTTTTRAPTTTAVATTTTTTQATTTTTLAADAHPELGISWATVFPPEGASAVYDLSLFGIEDGATASFAYGVPFDGMTLDRIAFGTPEPGNDAVALYFDASEPWQIAFVALQVFRASTTDGPETTESFAEPIVFDLLAGSGETTTIEDTIDVAFGSDSFSLGIAVDVTLRGRESVTVPAGTFDAFVYDIAIGGEFMGGGAFPIEIAVTPEALLVRMTNGSDESIELVEAWG